MIKYRGAERRQYVRLNSVFPIEFQLVESDTLKPISELMQGFTRDVSKGGLCLQVNNLKQDKAALIGLKKVKLLLTINMPLSSKPAKAYSNIAWVKEQNQAHPNSYLIGLSYDRIDQKDQSRIINYALKKIIIPKVTVAAFAALFIISSLFIYREYAIRKENKVLVERLVQTSNKIDEQEQKIAEIDTIKDKLEKILSENTKEIANLKSELRDAEIEKNILLQKQENLAKSIEEKDLLEQDLKKVTKDMGTLTTSLNKTQQEKSALEAQIQDILKGRQEQEKKLEEIKKTKSLLGKEAAQKMYSWLKAHQNPRTGLIVSYEGDPAIKDWAFTYDQALVSQAFVIFGDSERAKKIFEFYKKQAEKLNGGFLNAYYASNGSAAEYTVHCGPNIWLALSIIQHANKTGDTSYLNLAEQIADWVISIQGEDSQFGIKGGPKITWYSTEHNLDAYALFTLLHEKTKKDKYRLASERSLKWLNVTGYNRIEQRMNRGKGDSTIATDTFSWAIAAIGPEKLQSLGMDPDQIIKFAEDNCRVNVKYSRPSGEIIKVTGFDFAKSKHVGRGGVISTEWTAQMIITMRIMGDYHMAIGDLDTAREYHDKAAFYLNELDKLLMSSPSRTGQGAGCLPYSTQDDADTGHGWRTPKGTQTGSVAGTTYSLFAKTNYNPLGLKYTTANQN